MRSRPLEIHGGQPGGNKYKHLLLERYSYKIEAMVFSKKEETGLNGARNVG
jgi:hypothetical protein